MLWEGVEVKNRLRATSCHPLKYVVNYRCRPSGDIVT